MARPEIRLVPLGDPKSFSLRVAEAEADGSTLASLLRTAPALSVEPLGERMDMLVVNLRVMPVLPGADQPLYCPPGVALAAGEGARAGEAGLRDAGTGPDSAASAPTAPGATAAAPVPAGGGYRPGLGHPDVLDEKTAVRIAYDVDIAKAAEYLQAGLSVLVRADKMLVEYLAAEIAVRTGRNARVVPGSWSATAAKKRQGSGGFTDTGAGGRRQQILAELQEVVRNAGPRDLVVVAHLDLLAGGSDTSLSPEARELIDVLYEPGSGPDEPGSRRSKVVVLAFVDPSLAIPEVLANRFAVRLAVDALPHAVASTSGEPVAIGTALVTKAEAAAFAGFDPVQLYKHVAGMDAVRLRHAMIYALKAHPAGAQFATLLAELRVFKANASTASFEVPKVPFSDIGGCQTAIVELTRALALIKRADQMPEHLRKELMPRGFIFYGPPGTGKTLLAKAVATAMEATILIVSGPEVTDMYVGESERKVREIFAEARRNAPAIVVFDEFDSIASRRSGQPDGGARAGNAIVAQLLTEMDGFRPEVTVLVIGTTNRLDIIDEALLRPSRFRPVQIDLPDRPARREIAAVHARHFDVQVGPLLLDRIAAVTRDMNGDEIHSIFRDAEANRILSGPDGTVTPGQLGALVGKLRKIAVERELGKEQTGGYSRAAQSRAGRNEDDGAQDDDYVAYDPDAEAPPQDPGEGDQ